jgi:hypothetical protein
MTTGGRWCMLDAMNTCTTAAQAGASDTGQPVTSATTLLLDACSHRVPAGPLGSSPYHSDLGTTCPATAPWADVGDRSVSCLPGSTDGSDGQPIHTIGSVRGAGDRPPRPA